MDITLLGQGYEATSKYSVGNQLIKFFSQKDFHTFIGITAFASQAGVNGIAKYIVPAKSHLNIITIVTGVDQNGTSKEALEALKKLDINTYVHYHPSRVIFHPKIYLLEGEEKSELIIGSSNLTVQGLFTNVETSLLISLNNSIEADRKIVAQLKDYFKGIFDLTDPNLKLITAKLIDDLVMAKIVPTEAERKSYLLADVLLYNYVFYFRKWINLSCTIFHIIHKNIDRSFPYKENRIFSFYFHVIIFK